MATIEDGANPIPGLIIGGIALYLGYVVVSSVVKAINRNMSEHEEAQRTRTAPRTPEREQRSASRDDSDDGGMSSDFFQQHYTSDD